MRAWSHWLKAAVVATCSCQIDLTELRALELDTSAGQATVGESAATASESRDAKQKSAELVRRAFVSESEGHRSSHQELLEAACAAGGDFAPAYWQSGRVRVGDRWLTIDEATALAAQDELVARYRELRTKYARDKDGRLVLARWCQKNGLKNELVAHASQLFHERPDDPEVLKMLGLTWHQGQLLSTAQLATREQDQRKAKDAQREWQPRLHAIAQTTIDKSSDSSKSALAELRAIREPAAIHALEALAKQRQDLSLEVAKVLGHIPGEKATDALLRQALLSKWPDARLAACEQLHDRPAHGHVPKLLGALSMPFESKLEVVRESDGVRIRESITREGADAKFEKSIDHQVSLITPNPFLADIVGAVYAESFLSNKRTAKSLQAANRKLAEMNGAIFFVLEHATNQQLPRDPEVWWDWWRDYNVLTGTDKPTIGQNYTDRVEVPTLPVYPVAVAPAYCYHADRHPAHVVPLVVGPVPGGGMHVDANMVSCFAAGTQVWCQIGPQAIEDIQVGDRVLSQDPVSGELAFGVVLEATIGNQPMLAIEAGDDRIVATLGHVFWVSGTGWRMAKQLKIGDRLHTAGGWVEIRDLKKVPADETHNLVVANSHTFFVGASRILVHDYSLLQPTTAQVPGQAER